LISARVSGGLLGLFATAFATWPLLEKLQAAAPSSAAAPPSAALGEGFGSAGPKIDTGPNGGQGNYQQDT
jgi:hypothetical protein